ncbi:MAG: hypothetical protein Fur0032_23490 [Terrimicrobiaceae bacterium]
MRLLPAILAGYLLSLTARAGEKSYLIEDPFGVDHGVQAVTFEQTFDQPGVALASMGATVDGKPAFFQRRALETHADGSVKKGEWTLWLHLASPEKNKPTPPGSQPKFDVKLSWGGGTANPAAFVGTPVKISKDGDYLLVDTGVAQFRVPDNKPTQGPGGTQGPIAGFRTKEDTTWYGGNAFIEGPQISAVKTEVLADGPARAVLRVTFSDPEDISWISKLTFTAGSPVVKIHDTMDLQGAWVIDLTNDMAPDTQFACPWFDWESHNQRGTPSEKPLRAWKAKDIRGGEWPDLNEFFRLDPKWHDYQYMKGPYAWYYNKADRANKPTAFAMFAWNMSQWHPTNQSRPRVFVQGEKKGALRIRVPLTGGPHTRTLEAEDPADPIPRSVRTSTAERSWGIAAFPTPDIRSAAEFSSEARDSVMAELDKVALAQIRREKSELTKRAEAELKKAAATDKSIQINKDSIAAKMRELGWPDKKDEELATERLATMKEAPAEEVNRRAQKMASDSVKPARDASVQALVRFAHLPVSKIKDWVFTWPDMDKNVDHGIFRSLDELEALQKEIREGKTETAKAVNAYIDEMRKTLVINPDPKAKVKETVDGKFGRDWLTAKGIAEGDVRTGTVFHYSPPGVFKPDARWIYNAGYTEGMLNPTTAPRGIRALIWDSSVNYLWQKSGTARVDGKDRSLSSVNRNMATTAYIFSDPDFWNGRYYDWGIGNPNFHTDMHNIPGMVAAQLNTHPDAKRWADYSKREIQADVARSSWQPGGGWTESPGYTGHAFSVFLPTAHAFRNSGLVDPFAEKPFKDALDFNLNLVTPFDKRRGVRSLISIGDSNTDVRVENLQQAAMAYEKSDPPFASNLMAGARSAIKDGDLIKPGTLGNTLTTANLGITANPDWKLESRYFGGVGALMRSRFGQPDEGLVTFKAGPARNHYQGDELSFTMWANGDYLAVDYSSFYSPRMNPDWTHNKVSFGLTASSPVAKVMAFESTPEGDLAVAENVNESLQLMTRPYASARSLWDYPEIRTAPKTNRRLMLFVKHPSGSPIADYLVVRDELSGQIRDTLNPELIRRRLEVVLEENLNAVVRDASYAPSTADELFAEFEAHLQMLGADPGTAAALVAAARKAVQPRNTPFNLRQDSPDLEMAMNEALAKITFDHEPRANFHLLALDNPRRSKDRIDFKGQMDSDIAFFVATGQDAAKADINWFGWGHNQRPADFANPPEGASSKASKLPWMGGEWHSYRHGFILGRDVALATDKSSKLPPYAFGEMTQWVSLPFQGKDDLTVVLYPIGKGKPAPQFESLDDGKSVKVTVGGQSETITLATGQPVKIVRDSKETLLAASLPPIGGPQPAELTPRRTIEGMVDKEDDRPQFSAP